MKVILLGLVISVILVTSCTKTNPNITTAISQLGTLTADIDGIPTAFDSILVCTYFTRPALSLNEVFITAYKKNDTSWSNIQLTITGSDTILSGTYIDSVPNINEEYGFQCNYTPPNLPIWFSGDQSAVTRPAIQIIFFKDSVQGTFSGRVINTAYPPNLPPVTTAHDITNGQFQLKISKSLLGI